MNPVASARLITFLDWLRSNHSEVRSLHGLQKERFMTLAKEFELSQGRRFDWEVEGPWGSTHYVFDTSADDSAAMKTIKKIGS